MRETPTIMWNRTKHRHRHGPRGRIERLRRRLDLSEEQVAELRAIFDESRERMLAVLDDDQRERFEQMRHHRRHRHGEPDRTSHDRGTASEPPTDDITA